MTAYFPQFASIEGVVCVAFVTLPYPPALSTPAGMEREPNSHIWQTLFSDALHAVGQFVRDRVVRGLSVLQIFHVQPSSDTVLAHCFSACKTSVKTRGQIGLLAPLSAPAGVERGGGDRGGMKRQEGQHHSNQHKIQPELHWNLTPLEESTP